MAQCWETEQAQYLLSALVLPILIFIIIKRLKPKSSSKCSQVLPPGPNPWPILGNMPHMMGSSMPHVTLANLAKIYGPLISLRLGTNCVVVGSTPDVAMEILKTKDKILSGRHVPHAIQIPELDLNQSSLGWTDECNDNWKYLRRLCRTELFSNKAIESQAELREKNIHHLVNFVRSKEGETIKIAELAFATVFNILGNALVSRNFVGLEEKNENGGLKSCIREAMEVAAAPNVADFYPIFRKLDLQGIQKKSNDFIIRMRAVWEPIIEERRCRKPVSSSDHQDFLDTLLDNDFTNKRICQLFTELFSAGTDTTTSTIEWTLAELMKNQESMNKVRQEIDFEIKQDFPKNSDSFLKLPYLRACVKETLRLHPPAPLLLPHRALETCQVMSYTIPKDAQVIINVWAIGRDPSIWEEPLMFKPERFLNSNIDFKGNDFQFIPFSAGRRICPGLPMAAETVPLILVSLIHFFNWSLPQGKFPDEMDMGEKFGVTMQMEHPLLLIPQARTELPIHEE